MTKVLNTIELGLQVGFFIAAVLVPICVVIFVFDRASKK